MKKSISGNYSEQCSITTLAMKKKTLSESMLYTEPICFKEKRLIVLDTIKRGLYSVILLVQPINSKKTYALKLLNSPYKIDKRATDFLIEIEMIKKLQSKYIVKYYGEIISSIGRGMLLKYYPTGNLHDFLKDSNEENLLKKIYRPFCLQSVSAINYLHKQNPPIIHRDIKSPNFLLTRGFNLKLCDFNLSREDTEENRVGTLESWRTTPAWSAPEIVSNRYTLKSDIYSIGIVLWEILHTYFIGSYLFPFGGYDEITITTRLMLQPELRPSLQDIPEQWSAILESIWHIDPQKRPDCEVIISKIQTLKLNL